MYKEMLIKYDRQGREEGRERGRSTIKYFKDMHKEMLIKYDRHWKRRGKRERKVNY